jgi:hypothetical protein
VEPRVHGDCAGGCSHAADRVGEEHERCSEAVAEAASLGLGRRDHALVGDARRPGAREDEAASLGDDVPAGSVDGMLGLGRRLWEPDELGVGVREARAGFAPFVDERVKVSLRDLAAPASPRFGDELELIVGDVGERAMVLRRMHHDFLPLERGIEIRNDPYAPRTARGKDERLWRRAVLAAGAERADVKLFGGRGLELRACRARALGAGGSDRDAATGRGVDAEVGQDCAPSRRSRKGRSRSIGAGNTIVVDCDAPSSISV